MVAWKAEICQEAIASVVQKKQTNEVEKSNHILSLIEKASWKDKKEQQKNAINLNVFGGEMLILQWFAKQASEKSEHCNQK